MTRSLPLGLIALVAWGASTAERAQAAPTGPIVELALQTCFAQPRPVRRSRRPNPADLQKAQAEAVGITAADQVRTFWEHLNRVQRELTERNTPVPVLNVEDTRVAAIVDKAHVGLFFTSDGPERYLALHLQLGNESAQPIVVAREHIQAVIDGDTLPTNDIPPRLVRHGFPYGTEYVALELCQPAKELTVPARGLAGTWLVYGGLPVAASLPACEIQIQVANRPLRVPVNAVQRAMLDLTIETIGPQRGLALMTVGGMLNTFNMYALVDEVDALTAQKTSRFVVRWKPDTPPPHSQLMNWLQNSALSVGTGRRASEQLPAFPSAMRELHLVEPGPGNFLAPEYTSRPQAPPRVHANEDDAVAAALRATCLALSREALLEEIRGGHRLSRAAVLVHGAPRLEAADLPLVLQLSQEDEPAVRRAALLALGDFDQPAPLDRLERALRDGNEADLAAATVALSESRYQAARDRFAAVVQSGDEALSTRVVAVLAKRPRAEWADVFVRHAIDKEGRLQPDLIRALVQVNDPRLVEILVPALDSARESEKDLAFQILSDRREERAERAATEYVLERLQNAPPDALMMSYLNRTKDQRAIPALLRHLNGAGDKTRLINLLGQIGDVPVGNALVECYGRLQTSEQAEALKALRQLRHPQFVTIAGKALNSQQDILVSHAIQGLTQHGGPDAERLLCEALQKASRPSLLTNLGVAVANLGTSTARRALQEARTSDYPPRRDAALVGLQQMRRNSPGYPYWEQGLLHARDERWKEALEAYNLAAELDPQLSEAFAGQGDVHLKQSRPAEAERAFGKAYELDPASGLACSGLAIAMVLQGRLEEGLNTVEKVRDQFKKDVNYSYNVACVYGRAVEAVAKQPQSTERDERLAKFQKQALDDLKQAIELKFDDYEWMRKDPDLKSLHELPAFQQLTRNPEK